MKNTNKFYLLAWLIVIFIIYSYLKSFLWVLYSFCIAALVSTLRPMNPPLVIHA